MDRTWLRRGLAEIWEVVRQYPWGFLLKCAMLAVTIAAFGVSSSDGGWFLAQRWGFVGRVIPATTAIALFLPFRWRISRQLLWLAAILVGFATIWAGAYGISYYAGSSSADCLKFAKMTVGISQGIGAAVLLHKFFTTAINERAATDPSVP